MPKAARIARQWKLVVGPNAGHRLDRSEPAIFRTALCVRYELSSDLKEKKDLVADSAKKAAGLDTILMGHRADGVVNRLRDNPEYKPK
jgi:hypothetical protein